MSLYITAAQPNPPGRDVAARLGRAQNDKLNEEWVQFQATSDRDLVGDLLSHLTFDGYCSRTGTDVLAKFSSLQVRTGEQVRVHTGPGNYWQSGGIHHAYLGRSWFAWNNVCGDRVTLSYNSQVIDSAYYAPSPPEGELYRVANTDRLEPSGYRRYA
jgi:hypothetical protein